MKPLLRLIDSARADALARRPGEPPGKQLAGPIESQATDLCVGALSLLLRHGLTGCARSAAQAAELLERIADAPGVDGDMRRLCAEASERLNAQPLAVLR